MASRHEHQSSHTCTPSPVVHYWCPHTQVTPRWHQATYDACLTSRYLLVAMQPTWSKSSLPPALDVSHLQPHCSNSTHHFRTDPLWLSLVIERTEIDAPQVSLILVATLRPCWYLITQSPAIAALSKPPGCTPLSVELTSDQSSITAWVPHGFCS